MTSPEGREMIDRFRRDLRDDARRDALWSQMQRRIAADERAPSTVRRSAVIAIAVALAGAVTLWWLRPEAQPRTRQTDDVGAQQAVDDVVRQNERTVEPAVVPPPAELPPVEVAPTAAPPLQRPSKAATSPAVAMPTDDPFAREVALIVEAREAALRADWDLVATLLDRHAQAFPAGTLRRERMTLAIDRLCARGELDRAGEHARRLAATFPSDAAAQRRLTTPCPELSLTKPPTGGQ